MKKLNQYEWEIEIHGIGMGGYEGMLTWTAALHISTHKTFKTKEAAIKDCMKSFARKYKIKNIHADTGFRVVQNYEEGEKINETIG